MLTEPLSITVGATPISLPRIGSDKASADYQSADGNTAIRIAQSQSGGTRRTVASLKTSKIAPDPYTAVNARRTSQVNVTHQGPSDGVFTVSEVKDQIVALANFLIASSGAIATKIISGEK
jgi:hypothetical protein